MVVALDHGFPVGKNKTGHFACSGFEAAAMFLEVRAEDFHFQDLRSRSQPGFSPGVSRQHPRIDRVADNVAAKTEIILCHGVGGAVTGVIETPGHDAGIPNGLLYRVDTQPQRSACPGQCASDGRFACSRQPGENSERGHFLPILPQADSMGSTGSVSRNLPCSIRSLSLVATSSDMERLVMGTAWVGLPLITTSPERHSA